MLEIKSVGAVFPQKTYKLNNIKKKTIMLSNQDYRCLR